MVGTYWEKIVRVLGLLVYTGSSATGLRGSGVPPSAYWFILVSSQYKLGSPKTALGAPRPHWERVWVHPLLLVYTESCRHGPQGLGGGSQCLLVYTGALPVHAWEHRRALVAGQDLEAELAFAGALLSRDFSNFSAWHHRLRLLAPARNSGKGEAGVLPPERLKEGEAIPTENSWSFGENSQNFF